MSSKQVKLATRAAEDLAKSGLTVEHAKRLHIESLGSDSYKLPYFTPDGEFTDFYRVKHFYDEAYLEKRKKAKKKKPPKYTQPAGTQPEIYLPPLLDVKWREVLNDPTIPLAITEGEKKAGSGCSNGIPCIGIGGTWNWRSRKLGIQLLPALNAIAWKGRKVRVVLDSDTVDNDGARAGGEWLVAELNRRGAEAALVIVPANGEPKMALDDYIVRFGAEATMAMLANPVAATIEPYMDDLNKKIAVILDTGEFVALNTGRVYGNTALRNIFSKFGDLNPWIKWNGHNEVKRLVFEPGTPSGITSDGEYNTWPGWKVEPLPCKLNDVKPWLNLLARVLPDTQSEHRHWVDCWLGYPIKYPGTKLNTAVLLWSIEHGTGKNALAVTMAHIYGPTWGKVDGSILAGTFNEWAINKQFIVGDELKIGDKRGLTNKLKDMITEKRFRINSKNQKTYEVNNHINYFFTSNHPDAMYVEGRDRRMAVFHATEQVMTTAEWREYEAWLKNGGAGKMRYYFENILDYSAFDPLGAAPITAAKLEMIEAGRTDVETWLADLKSDPNLVLKTPYDLYRSIDLYSSYDPQGRERIKPNGFATKLGEAGVPRALQNHTLIEGVRQRLWIVRGDVARYQHMTPKQLADAYRAERHTISGAAHEKFDGRVQ